jgi:hypothetical protein
MKPTLKPTHPPITFKYTREDMEGTLGLRVYEMEEDTCVHRARVLPVVVHVLL